MAAGSIVIDLLMKTGSFATDTGRAEKSLNKLKKEAASVASTFKNLAGLAIGGAGIAGIINLTDQYQKFTAQLKLSASSSDDFVKSYESVQRIANASQSDIGAIATLYARLSNSLKDAGVSQQEVADISETVALALRVNGASAGEAASAMLQLSQAFGSGRLAGEEFRAIAESAPGLLRQLSKELGVAYGELKQMAADGKLTGEALRRAFTNQEYLAGLREQSNEIQTVSGAMTVLRNNLTLMFGETNQATGATKTLSDTIIIFSNNLDVAAGAVSTVLQTILVLGANVKFVFQGIGRDIGGMAAQLVSLAKLDFKGFSFIGDELKKDAKEARAELDKFEKDILNPKAPTFTPFKSTGVESVVDPLAGQRKALAEFNKDFANKREQLQAEREKYKGLLGELYTPDIDRRLVEKFTTKTPKAKDDEGQKLIESMRERIALIGKESEAEKLLAQIAVGSIKFRTEAQKQVAIELASTTDAINKSLEARKAQEDEVNNRVKEGKALTASLLDPLQKYSAELENLNKLREEGAIGGETYYRALANIQQGYNDTAESTKLAADAQARLNELLGATPTAQLEKMRDDMILLGEAFNKGLDEATFLEAVQTRLGRLPDQMEEATDKMTESAKQAAANMQDAFAGFLFDPFKDGLGGMLQGFVTTLHKMASEALASQIFKLLGDSFGGSGGFLGAIGSIFGGAFANGGSVSEGKSYLVGERGPEMFTPRSAGAITPNNQMGGSSPVVNVRNINVLDPSIVGDYLGGDEGEQLIMNVVQRNKGALSF